MHTDSQSINQSNFFILCTDHKHIKHMYFKTHLVIIVQLVVEILRLLAS